jgi:hypothetical protein
MIMDSKITVDFHHYGRIHVDGRAFLAWFPDILREHGYGSINGSAVVNLLYLRLKPRYRIPKDTIRYAFHQLLIQLRYHFSQGHGETRMRVSMILGQLLKQDVFSGGFVEPEGLIRARHSFVVLAYLAHECNSFLLAGALMQFYSEAQPMITRDHADYLVREWQPALRKLEDMGAEDMMPEPPLVSFWPQGRAPPRLALAWPGHRARSAPPRHRHSPDMRLALPAYPNSAYTSPMMSPVGYPHAGYFDELGNLQYQQQEMNMKLDNVDGKLDVLINGMMY